MTKMILHIISNYHPRLIPCAKKKNNSNDDFIRMSVTLAFALTFEKCQDAATYVEHCCR